MYAYFDLAKYTVQLKNDSKGSTNVSSLEIQYSKTATFTVTPNTGYYLSSITCTNGYTVSGFTTTTSSTGKQTVTISNNNKLTGSTCNIAFKSACTLTPGQVVGTYGYNGGVQNYSAHCNGTYKLEVWGAQGGSATCDGSYCGRGGYGGYATGNIVLTKGTNLYIAVGSAGGTPSCNSSGGGGFNGGGHGHGDDHGSSDDEGDGCETSGGGGGATHIAKTNRGVLANYNSYRSEVLIVAGGGGGATWDNTGHSGGGSGGSYSFGLGQSGTGAGPNSNGTPGGGGGWLGGYAGSGADSGGQGYGGSGYIGGVTGGSMSNDQRSGHGYARITFISVQ